MSPESAGPDSPAQRFGTNDPELLAAASFIAGHAPAPLNTPAYLHSVLFQHDYVVQLLDDLRAHLPAERLAPTTEVNTPLCDVWSFFGLALLRVGRPYQALEVFDALYLRLLEHQASTGTRFHKGLPLFRMSQSYLALGWPAHAKRYMMLTLCEDAVSGSGSLRVPMTGSYGMLAWRYGLSDSEITRYAAEAFAEYRSHATESARPEWMLQHLDQRWKSEIPSVQEAGAYRVTRQYCGWLAGKLGEGDGKALELLGEYLIGAMPGCRTHRRAGTPSTDYDIIASVEGPVADFRSELGRYFVCECKDKREKRASFSEVAKFCRVLDSVKAKFGIIFCPLGHSGEGKEIDADREIMKVYQDRGIVIVVIDRDDLEAVSNGANFISLLREKYEGVRLDLS